MSDTEANARAPANYPKQAVVVIHGIGEQSPMDTIKGFVRAVWETDPAVTGNPAAPATAAEVWSKPDTRTGSLELRRITTRQSRVTPTFPANPAVPDSGGVRTDFYELYWADLSAGSTLEQIKDWTIGLLFRNPWRQVPADLLGAWILLWLIALAVVYLVAEPAIGPDADWGLFHPYGWVHGLPGWAPGVAGAVLGWLTQSFLVPYVGRIVRYTRATPANIKARADIRERGLKLLANLHEAEYERIIVVGHSLGAILGYDLISYFWAERLASHTVKEDQNSDEFKTFRAVETALAAYEANGSDANLEAFRKAQREFCQVLRRRSKHPNKADGTPDTLTDWRWLITDFVTLGSPLAHADILLTRDRAAFDVGVTTRQFPVAPPVREVLDKQYHDPAKAVGLPLSPPGAPALLSFRFKPDKWQMHHAAPFAAIRWTNIYDPARFIFLGDIVSGPHTPLFGKAIVDVNLRSVGQCLRLFTHTKYWSIGKTVSPALRELRKALNLDGSDPV